jgi:hypothetical protein
MIPEPVRQELLEAIPELYWVDVTHPDEDISQLSLRPQLRWQNEEFSPPEEPYESVALGFTETGVVEESTPVDRDYGIEAFDREDVEGDNAHGRRVKGVQSHDTLEIIVTAKGNISIEGYQIGPRVRARALCHAVHSFLAKHWKTRPLDLFDENGEPIDDDHPEVPDRFADELEVPLLPKMIPGRGPEDVTDQVDASGAQFNAAVEIAYVDTWSEHHYLAEKVPVDTEVTSDAYDVR